MSFALTLLAVESSPDLTLPWQAWLAIGTGLTSAVVWLARTWKGSTH